MNETFHFSRTYLYKLRLVTSRLDRILDQSLRSSMGLTLSQFSLLAVVGEHQPINQRQAAYLLGISPAAINRQVDIAVQNQWIEICTADILGQALNLTKSGREVLASGQVALQTILDDIFVDQDSQASLMNHIDALLGSTKKVITNKSKEKVLL